MMYKAWIRVDFTSGKTPGALQAAVCVIGHDGVVLEEYPPQAVSPGTSVSVGPASVALTLVATPTYQPTPAPAADPAGPAVGAAGAKPPTQTGKAGK